MSTLGAVLTGGASTRMGTDKTGVEIAGRTMLSMVGEALASVLPRVVILGPASGEPFESWPDQLPAPGPLAGIATALERMDETRVLVVAVDQPFVRPETLAGIAAFQSNLPVVPVDAEGVRQVTCALYPKEIADAAGEEARAEGSIQSLLDRVSFQAVTPEVWRGWGEDGRSWYSVDTPEALATGIERYLEREDGAPGE